MTKFYLATPYTKHPGGIHQAYDDALYAARRFVELGLDVFSPVVQFHPISLRMFAKPHSFWMARCMPWLMASDVMVVPKMPGRDTSDGVAEECRLFRELGKPVIMLGWPLTDAEMDFVLKCETP